jgi:hypothetical protein
MNKRIQEMAEQAGFLATGDFDDPVLIINDPDRIVSLELTKFAELIVRECSRVIVNGGYRNPAFGEKHPLTPPEIAKMIEEHFGVE